MFKTLLYLNEDLASSIALRYTAYFNKFVKLALFVMHVEELDEKNKSGADWARGTWEEGIASSGKQLIDRMLRTENIDCPLAGRPKVFIGEREKNIIYELRNGGYNLFIEGYLNTANPDDFYERVSSSLYTNTPCSILVVKNLTISKKCALFLTDSVDPETLVEKSMAILGDSEFSFNIVFFKYKENEKLETLDNNEGGAGLQETKTLLAAAGKTVQAVIVLSGTPEQVGDYLKEYALVVSTLPKRKCMKMLALSRSHASVMLVQ